MDPPCVECTEATRLCALSPLDGRYAFATRSLAAYFSEFAFLRYRLLVECRYLMALPSLCPSLPALFPPLRLLLSPPVGSASTVSPPSADAQRYPFLASSPAPSLVNALETLATRDFTLRSALRIKHLERTTNHDVKAIEYFLREELSRLLHSSRTPACSPLSAAAAAAPSSSSSLTAPHAVVSTQAPAPAPRDHCMYHRALAPSSSSFSTENSRPHIENPPWHPLLEWVHFGLTSQDVNSVAQALSLRDAITKEYLPAIRDLVLTPLQDRAQRWIHAPMLGRTHGQPATPTRVGAQLMVFVERLHRQLSSIEEHVYYAKFGGATGGLNAHYAAVPSVDWQCFADRFLSEYCEGLERLQCTTQIAHNDSLAALLDNLRRVNVILIDLAQDMWMYIGLGYFSQRTTVGQVGSSCMPHKVNPIDWESAEGNFGLANSTFTHLSHKLPISRLQRDLSDTTVMRSLGVPLAHSILGIRCVGDGLCKIQLNKDRLREDLERNWIVVAEGMQTILRAHGYHEPYEMFRKALQNRSELSRQDLHALVDSIDVSPELRDQLRALTPFNYLGKAARL